MDVGTGLVVLGSAWGGAKVVERLLGPTADYVGVGLKNWAEKRVENVDRIIRKAADKLGDDIEKPGGVPPKVLKEVLDEGSYCDDELTAEYFGGVLASSRTGNSRDDRAATYLKAASELSAYQVRFHYITYLSCRRLFEGSELRPTHTEDRHKMFMYMDHPFILQAMEFRGSEPAEDIILHCLTGLHRAGLIEYGPWGSAKFLNERRREHGWVKQFSEPGGFTVAPTEYGFDLWLWGIGAGHISRSYCLKPESKLPKLPDVNLDRLPVAVIDR